MTIFFFRDDCYACWHECKQPPIFYDITTKGLTDNQCPKRKIKDLAIGFEPHWSLMTSTLEI
jgi:hypothetical protein